MHLARRYFTPEEANDLLPEVEPLVHRARDLAHQFRSLPADAARTERETIRAQVMDVVTCLNAYGVELNGLSKGVLDFPGIRNGRQVALSWQLGEERVRHWHDPDTRSDARREINGDEPWVWSWYT